MTDSKPHYLQHERMGDCFDNAVVESFFAALKMECMYVARYTNRAQARRSIFE